ncbi:MAG: RNA 2',3'-cyclic phosphodiesterase [SAR324 cluster bacterium]|nr:RNA 2',3'-cyclic phosphodiesterase [SAR324 cluster bacterium]
MPRLFIAIDFPSDIQDQLLELCDFSLNSASWVEHFHLTVQFVGEVDQIMFEEIKETLAEIQEPAFSITLRGLGFFPPRKQPRVLWVGIEKNEALHHLKVKIDHRLQGLRLSPDKRKFHPHITLARLNNPSDDEVGAYLSRYSLFKTNPIPVAEFSLFSSFLSSHGAIHTEEARYLLSRKNKTNWNSVDHTRDS